MAGADEFPAPKRGARVEFVICAAASACKTVSDAGEQAGRALGWTVETVAASGDAASYNSAMDTALSRRPNAIVAVGVPGSLITDKLATARARGIVTVSAPDVPSAGVSRQPYDGYVSYRQPLQHQLMAAAIIADSGGHGHAIEIQSTDQPDSMEGARQFARIMKTCGGCKTYLTPWTIPDAADSAKASNIIQAALQAHPDARYLAVPYDIGLPAVISAVRAAGGKVKVLAKDGSQVELQALRRGDLFAVPGVGLDWLGYAALFQANLGMSGKPYLNAFDQGLGVHLFTRANTLTDAAPDYTRWVDFKSRYQQLWGGR